MSDFKNEKFKKLAEKRVNEAIKKLQLIGNLANTRNYSYTDSQVKQIFSALDTEIRELKAKFNTNTKEQKFKFK